MRIIHNISALNAFNKLNKNNKIVANKLEKLSSGFRINKAGDDAAGLAISEKMRAQIRGLQQAERNIQDGISFLHVIDGGLGQIENTLIRLRELAVQAANDTLTFSDRQAIQKEVEEILNAIDDIANDTEFNGIKALRPPIMPPPPTTVLGESDIIFIIDSTGSMTSPIENVKSNIDNFVNKLQSSGVDVRLGLVDYKDVVPSEGGDPIIKYGFTSDLDTFKTYLNSITVSGGGDGPESGLEAIKEAAGFSFRSDVSKNLVLITDAYVHDDADGDGGDGKSSYDVDEIANELKVNGIKLNVVGPTSGPVYDQLKRLSEPTGGSYMNLYGDFASELDTLATTIIVDSGTVVEEDEMPTLLLQVGANSKNTFSIELFDARIEKLGIESLRVDSQKKAEEAIGKIDSAINTILNQRGKFGAYQNALEHIYNNVSNTELNLAASESYIRDADIAKEMMELTKSNIIAQASQAMLAQANHVPEAVLLLLR